MKFGMGPRRRGAGQPELYRRRHTVEKMLLRGITNYGEMAAHCGVSINTVLKDVKFIQENWLNDSREHAQSRAALRVKQLEGVIAICHTAFERSQMPVERTVIVEKVCQDCDQGFVPGDEEGKSKVCPKCKGKCKIITEERHIEGLPGEPSYLKVIKDCIVECARIEGCHPRPDSKITKSLERVRLPDGTIMERLEELTEQYNAMPIELIVEAKAALDKIKARSLEIEEPKVIEVHVEGDDSPKAV
jgi:hypothetical protein